MNEKKKSNCLAENTDFIGNLDMFGASLPPFNIGGESQVRTCPGGVLSLIAMLLTFMFAVLKMQQFFEKSGPSIVQNFHEFDSHEEAIFDTTMPGFNIAFALDPLDNGPFNDPKMF